MNHTVKAKYVKNEYDIAVEAVQAINKKIDHLEHDRMELIVRCMKMIRELPASEYRIRLTKLWNDTKSKMEETYLNSP